MVGGVVVRGDGLGVGVDHDGLEASSLQGEDGVDAAAVELNPLANAVGTAAQNHDFLLARIGVDRLVIFAVG